MQTAPTINLVKNKKPAFLDQFIRWALSIGRVVVILTELVALGAFLYRFSLDRELIDLHDKIAQEQNIVQFLKKNEDTYRSMQTRITSVKTFSNTQATMLKQFEDISNLFPQSMLVKNFVFASDSLHVEGTIQSIGELTNFLNNLKQYPGMAFVSLDKIENKTSLNVIAFSISAGFKKAPTAKGVKTP
jgi:Tfp pilus assembly protein PilN